MFPTFTPTQEQVKVDGWENAVFSVDINIFVLDKLSEIPHDVVGRVPERFDIKVMMQ